MAAQYFESLNPAGEPRRSEGVPAASDRIVDILDDRPYDGRPKPAPHAARRYDFLILSDAPGRKPWAGVIADGQTAARTALELGAGESARCWGWTWHIA